MTGFRAVAPADAPVDAAVRPPGSKSLSIRALVASALAEGDSRLEQPLEADDTIVARQAMQSLGVKIAADDGGWTVSGSGGRLRAPTGPVDAGASGLTARAVIALASLVDGPTTVVGRDRLPERPMGGLVDALNALGVMATAVEGHLPVTVHGSGALPGGTVSVPSHQTSQFASALLLAAPRARGELTITPTGLEGSQRYLEITIRTMKEFGAVVEPVGAGYRIRPTGYYGTDVVIEPDASAAAYPMLAAAITGGRVTIEGLGSESLQPDLGIARVFEMMGCVVGQTREATTIDATGIALQAVDVDLSGSPDGSLAVAVAALFADGPSRLRGLGALRFKESDRLAATATEIIRLGADARIEGDDLNITPGELRPTRVSTYGDHRMAMSFAVAGLRVPGVEIADPDVVGKTWPGFWDMLSSIARSA